MKILTYQIMGYTGVYNPGTKEVEQVECPATVTVECPTQTAYDSTYPIVEKEAIPGTIEVSGEFDYPIAPHNVLKGEYVTIGGVLYKATENIPNGESVIVGQNAVKTTIEEQLYELKGE